MLLIFAVFFLHGAWPVPDVNETHYLSKAKHYWNPDWCRHDFFLNTPDAHEVFCWTFGWVTKWLSLDATAWLGRLLTWALLAWSWRRLSWALLPRNWLAVLSAALFVALNENAHMAGEWVIGGVEAKGFSYVLVLLAFEAVLRGRWNRAWLWLGLASAMHAIVGGWSAIAVAVAWLASSPEERPRLRAMLPGLIGGFVLALPGLWFARRAFARCRSASRRRGESDLHLAVAPPSNGRPVQGRLSQPASYVVGRVAIAANRRENRHRRTPVPLDRERGNFIDAHRLWTRLVVALESDLGQRAAAVLLVPHVRRARADGRGARRAAVLAATCGVATEGRTAMDGWVDRRDGDQSVGPRIASAARHGLVRAPPVVPRADKSMVYSDWRDVCKWAGEHTDPGAQFITPRMACSFRWYAGRGEVVTWKDIPQNAAGIVAWWHRLTDLFAVGFAGGTDQPPAHWVESLAQLGPKRLAELAEKYHADYVILELFPDVPPLPLHPLYANASYAVYRFAHDEPTAAEQSAARK